MTSTFATYSPPPAPPVITATHYDCSENRSPLIAVSAVSLGVVVALATVILILCLLMARMRMSKAVALHANNEIHSKNVSSDIDVTVAPNEAYAVPVIPSTTMQVPVTRNEAYGVHDKRTAPEDDYELILR